MTTRQFRKSVGGTQETREWFLNDSAPAWTFLGGNLVEKVDEVTVNANWPDWRGRIRSRLSATTALSGLRFSYSGNNSGFLSLTRGIPGIPSSYTVRQRRGCFGTQLTHPNAPTISLDSAHNVALTKLVRSIVRTQRSMQGLVFIGEIREAIRLVRNPFRLLDTGIREFIAGAPKRHRRRKGQVVSLRDLHRNVSNAWLENSFGLQPLIHDIKDGLGALSRISKQVPPVGSIGGESSVWQLGPTSKSSGTIGAFLSDSTFSSQQRGSVRFHGICVLRPLPACEAFGITLSDVLPAIWELIPYSFLVDYFSNVGDIIEAFSVNSSSVGWIEKGTLAFSENALDLILSPSPPPTGWENKDISCNYGRRYVSRRTEVSRSNYTGNSLVPALEFRIPGTGMQWLNIASLGVLHSRASNDVYRGFRR